KIPAAEARALRQLADNDIKSRLRSSGLNVDKLWHADASLKFPNRAELTGIYRDDSGDLRFVWHRGEETWKREPSQDYQTELDGDLYQFKASRYLAKRAVIRCEIRPAVGLVGLFLQVPTDVGHDEVLTEVQTRVRSIFDLSDR